MSESYPSYITDPLGMTIIMLSKNITLQNIKDSVDEFKNTNIYSENTILEIANINSKHQVHF